MRVLLALCCLVAAIRADVCDPNPCFDAEGNAVTEFQTVCSPVADCETEPCFTCHDCRTVRCAAPQCTEDLQYQNGCCLACREEEVFCTMDAMLCPDGSTVVRDPKNGCAFPKCADVCDPNPCFDANGNATTEFHTVCSPIDGCFTPPCFTCHDCRTVRCAAPQCAEELQYQNGCCRACRPEPMVCTDDVQECEDGSFVSRDPNNECAFPKCASVCDNNPCADSSLDTYDETRQICTPEPKACFTTPCPQYRCDSVCDPVNPCLDPRVDGYDFNKPHCVAQEVQCFVAPCPPIATCEELDCSMVRCASVDECGPGERRANCCGACTPVPNWCEKGERTCDDGSVVTRDPANNCEFTMCPECALMLCAQIAECGFGFHLETPHCCPQCVPDVDSCANNPCADSSLDTYDETRQICVVEPKACFTTPCPQYRCDSVCDPVNPCLDPRVDGYDFNKPHCKAQEVQCVMAPCPPIATCEELDCSMVRCASVDECGPGERRANCCGACTPVPNWCEKGERTCDDGSVVTRDPANDCSWTMCPECALMLCAQIAECGEGFHLETLHCCPECISDIPDPCEPNPCASEELNTMCIPSPKECFTLPCDQFECIEPIMCTMELKLCEDGVTSVGRDPRKRCAFSDCPPSPCDGNPCADTSLDSFDESRQICTPEPKQCKTEPCPQYACHSVCDPNPCLDPRVDGYDFARPHCEPVSVACLVAPCPQYECQELDCSLVKCMQWDCAPGFRKANCCGECMPVPDWCEKDEVVCDDGSILTRDKMNNCEFPKCKPVDVCDPNPCAKEELNTWCVPAPKACFTTPCPQYDCREPMMCTMDAKICEDGVTSVGRDPTRGCAFRLCPECELVDCAQVIECDAGFHIEVPHCCPQCVPDVVVDPCEPNPCLDTSLATYDATKPACSVDSAGMTTCGELFCAAVLCLAPECTASQHLETRPDQCCPRCVDDEMCTEDVKTCEDGVTMVARDPKNHCEWESCDVVVCTMEAKICEDGVTSVGRDPKNNCEFTLCPECAAITCAIPMCAEGSHIETPHCCPECVPDVADPCLPNPCEAPTPYCLPAPKACFTTPCPQYECSATDAQKGSTSSTTVKLTKGGVAGVTVGTIAGVALLAVGGVFLVRAQINHKKGTTPLNSHQESPENSMRESRPSVHRAESVSVTVESPATTNLAS